MIFTETEEGTILLDGKRGKYWHINGTGLAVLRDLLAGETLEVVALRVAQEYNVNPAIVLEDSRVLLQDLTKAGLVKGVRR